MRAPTTGAIAAIAFCAAGALHAQAGAAATAAAVRAADISFARHAQEVPVARAFRETMDPVDGLQFGGGAPVRGADAIYKAMGGDFAAAGRLDWTPVDAWGSASGDLGVTTGTWKAWILGGSKPPLTGRDVTVWRKDAKGVWKALIDIGNPDPK